MKVYYRPIEAAIRWSGLLKHETRILKVLKKKRIPNPEDFPEWPTLRLNLERLYDALRHGELPCGLNGVTAQEPVDLNHPDLTIRFVDLKAWMRRYYPGERPRFLFNRRERLRASLGVNGISRLLAEREALKFHARHLERENAKLQKKHVVTGSGDLTDRAERSYLHIIGTMLALLLGRSPAGLPYSSFKSQEAVVSAMVAHYGERLGISERTLHAKFAAAKRLLAGD